ncbi:MAG: Asp23/Gls24 family envelope stress response protein [Culicoidibacterales bacterium]
MKKEKQSTKFIYFPDNTHGTIAINPLSLPYALYMSILEIDGVGGTSIPKDAQHLYKVAAKNMKYKIENGEVSIDLKIEIERRVNAAEIVSKVQKTIKEQLQYIFDIVVGDVNVEIINIVS